MSKNVLKLAAVKLIKPRVGAKTWDQLKQSKTPTEVVEAARTEVKQRRGFRAMSLTEIAIQFETDKWGAHRYTPHYEHHFGKWRHDDFTMFEIGIGGYSKKSVGGASLRMWKHYFSRATIVGLDIEDKTFVQQDRVRVYVGSQVDEALLKKIAAESKNLRIILDDGSHRPEHIRASFKILFPLLETGGVYVLEDVQTSYWPEFGGSEDLNDPTTTMALVKDLIDGLQYEEFIDESYQPSYSDLNVVGVHVYHNLVFIEKGVNAEGTNRRKVLWRRYRKPAVPTADAVPTPTPASPPAADGAVATT